MCLLRWRIRGLGKCCCLGIREVECWYMTTQQGTAMAWIPEPRLRPQAPPPLKYSTEPISSLGFLGVTSAWDPPLKAKEEEALGPSQAVEQFLNSDRLMIPQDMVASPLTHPHPWLISMLHSSIPTASLVLPLDHPQLLWAPFLTQAGRAHMLRSATGEPATWLSEGHREVGHSGKQAY